MTTNGDAPTGAGVRNRHLREFYQAAYAKGADVAFSNWSATEADAVVASSISGPESGFSMSAAALVVFLDYCEMRERTVLLESTMPKKPSNRRMLKTKMPRLRSLR